MKLMEETLVDAGGAVSEVATNPTWSWDAFFQNVIHWLQTSGLKLLVGLIALFVLFFIVDAFARGVKKRMEKKGRDKTITKVTHRLIKYGLKIVLFVLFLGYVGIDTAGIGIIGASLSVAIGLAVQGSLANLAGWFVIIVMRPFTIGDYIKCQGEEGTVEDIRVFYTYIATTDNKVIMIPNGALANGNITNYSKKETRRVENMFQVAYGEDVAKAMRIIKEVVDGCKYVLRDIEPFISVKDLGAHGIDIVCRTWVNNADYWNCYFYLLDAVLTAFEKNNIEIPFEQLDVHIVNKTETDNKK